MKKITVMIVDDHTLIRESWSFFLSGSENLEIVAECGDGRSAIQLAKELRPDIVLLDINMEPVDGFEVLKTIRKLTPATRIIGVSMHSEPVFVKKLLRMGAKGYVTKNSTGNEMLEAIGEVSKGNIFVCQAVKKILADQLLKKDTDIPDINSLSRRELEVVSLLSEGNSSKEIAAALGVALKTVEVHRYNVLKKMKQKNTISLVQYINANAVEL
jgi:two-component system invasion response regulator UvrY